MADASLTPLTTESRVDLYSHPCLVKLKKHLAERNTELSMALMWDGPDRLMVQTQKIDPKGRGKAQPVLVTYCPFCGERLI